MSTRTRKSQRHYMKYQKTLGSSECQFCKFTPEDAQILKEWPYFWLVKNIFGYDVWDSTGVKKHFMIVPKRHITGLGELNNKEQSEFFKIINEYEHKNFSIYARSPANTIKSVPHQHTHLIQTDNKIKRLLIYLKKPHLLVSK